MVISILYNVVWVCLTILAIIAGMEWERSNYSSIEFNTSIIILIGVMLLLVLPFYKEVIQ